MMLLSVSSRRFRVHSLLGFVLLMVRCVEFGAGMAWVSVVFFSGTVAIVIAIIVYSY